MSSPFAYSAPSPPSPSPSPDIPDENSTDAFYSLLLASNDIASPSLTNLADTLLNFRIETCVAKEMKALAGELRDEWKLRVGRVKADWMARYIPEGINSDRDEGQDEAEVLKDPLPPTILSDTVQRDEMSHRVDSAVEKEFGERIIEAETRIRKAVEEKEKLEVEVFIGSLLLDARAEEEEDEDVAQAVKAGISEALDALGYTANSAFPNQTATAPDEVEKVTQGVATL